MLLSLEGYNVGGGRISLGLGFIPVWIATTVGRPLQPARWFLLRPGRADGGTIDIGRAREVLDEDHFDLDKIKDRILDYLAVRKLRQERGGGAEPPGVTGTIDQATPQF